MKNEYNEVYGWMPTDIVNRLDPIDRTRMFMDYIMRKPTTGGRKIVIATIDTLGEEFLEYMIRGIVEAYQEDDEPLTKEDLIEAVKDMLVSFATDLNSFREYVDTYLEETGDSEIEENAEPKKQMPLRDEKGRFIKKQK